VQSTDTHPDATGQNPAALNDPGLRAPVVVPRLRTNAVWMVVATFANAAARFVITALIAKLGTKAMVGRYGWAVAFCLPAITLFRFGARTLISTDAHDRFPFRQYLSFTVAGSLIAILVVLGMLLFQGYDQDIVWLVLIVTLWNAVESVSDLFSGLFQRRERMDLLAKACILQAIAICVLVTLSLVVTGQLLWCAFALVVAALLRLWCYEFPVGVQLLANYPCNQKTDLSARGSSRWSVYRPEFRRLAIQQFIYLGAPLTAMMFIMITTNSVPRYVINDALDDASLGVFVALYSLAQAQNLIVGSVSLSLSARLAVLFVERKRTQLIHLVAKTILISLAVGIPGLAIAAVAGKTILSLAFTPAYAADNDVFLILMLVGIAEGIAQVFGTMVTSMRRFAVQVPIQVARLTIVYFGGVWAIQRWGLAGVAWVLFATAIFTIACYAILCWKGLYADAKRELEPTLITQSR
jgi:O-antigen/teichoic acid export membrane protein